MNPRTAMTLVIRCGAMSNHEGRMTVALISAVYHEEDGERRLRAHLAEARERGAALAVLPELPLNPWSPATKSPRDEDAEPPNGPRAMVQRAAARDIGIGLIGGAIVVDPDSGARRNMALVIDSSGDVVARYCKLHLPEEPGFWETSHYEPGTDLPQVIDGPGLRLGVQICSDANRPEVTHLLGALGAEVVIMPRATEKATWPGWQVVFRANAITSCLYVLSVNRPAPEQDVLIGGPSIAVGPRGEVLAETTETLATVTLERQAVLDARMRYPGYLAVRSELYARGWRDAASCPGRSGRTALQRD